MAKDNNPDNPEIFINMQNQIIELKEDVGEIKGKLKVLTWIFGLLIPIGLSIAVGLWLNV